MDIIQMHPCLEVAVLEVDFAEEFSTSTVGENFIHLGHQIMVRNCVLVYVLVITNPMGKRLWVRFRNQE